MQEIFGNYHLKTRELLLSSDQYTVCTYIREVWSTSDVRIHVNAPFLKLN
jgi:hypothetical protein